MKYIKTFEELNINKIRIITYQEYLKENRSLQDALDFCNRMFPMNRMSLYFKKKIYDRDTTVVLIALDDNIICGLLESWIEKGERLLGNICVR